MLVASISNSLEVEFENTFSKDLKYVSKFKNSLTVLIWQLYFGKFN
jgi:hypothetical protein